MKYFILIPKETITRANQYLHELQVSSMQPGALLKNALQEKRQTINALELLGKLIDTKKTQIFAESAVFGDGSDWNLTELGLLGDISISIPVTIFDDGNHYNPTPHSSPFSGVLIFTPGALLRNGHGCVPADWNEVTSSDGALLPEGYYALYKRRLLPVFHYINNHAKKPRSALITIPGLGCGQFAGPFQGKLGSQLKVVLQKFLTEEGKSFSNIKAVYFDPYNECKNDRYEIHGISLMIRPLSIHKNKDNAQLCHPSTYEEEADNFSNCRLYSIVAWDHVSWPGNDFFAGARITDDGVKAAATNSMSAITNVKGKYDPQQGKYQPPPPYSCWRAVVEDQIHNHNLQLWNPKAVWRISEE